MIFHISVAVDSPEQSANFFAKLWGGRAYAFPPFAEGSWFTLAGDERNSGVEFYPRGSEMHRGGPDATEVQCVMGQPRREQAHHAAIATPLATAEVLALAEEAGIPARVCDRGPFHVIELWVDGCLMFEVLPPDMQAEYLRSMTIEGWEGFLAAAQAA